jgi:hypothetical protein
MKIKMTVYVFRQGNVFSRVSWFHMDSLAIVVLVELVVQTVILGTVVTINQMEITNY